eukprot:Selendium_serpulae@DN5742_c0_g1_i1.p5
MQIIDVNGPHTAPIYQFLKADCPELRSADGKSSGYIGWNYGKILCNYQGRAIKYFSPKTNPLSFEDEIKQALEAVSNPPPPINEGLKPWGPDSRYPPQVE